MKYQTQVNKSHYSFDKYLNQERWISYYHQLKETSLLQKRFSKKTASVLEVGPGDGIVNSALNKLGFKVKSLDVDPKLKPDYVMSLPHVPKGKFDIVLCSQVLEHIEYRDSIKALKNFARIARYCVISVPQKGITFSMSIKIWFFRTYRLYLSQRSPRKLKLGGQHYWELDANGITQKVFERDIKISGFEILKNFRVPEFPYHHFYILKSKNYEKNHK